MSDSKNVPTPQSDLENMISDLFSAIPSASPINPFTRVKQFSRATPMTSFPSFDPTYINRLLSSGYCAYLKMDGVHARIYIRSGNSDTVKVAAQSGKDCTDKLSSGMKANLLRLFPGSSRTEVEGFYAIESKVLYLFDITMSDGKPLREPFVERWQRLPRVHGSEDIVVLRLLKNMREIRSAIRDHSFFPALDGVVLRDMGLKYWHTNIRCRFPLP